VVHSSERASRPAISQGNYQDNAIEELKHRLGELEKERDRLLQMYNDASAAMNRLLEDHRTSPSGG
jgi:hypothetical protein